jgi:hypothetical protein
MNIGLVDVDSHNFPNLPLMKLSAYHKNKGDNVEFAVTFTHYDILYRSKVFTFSQEYYRYKADCVKEGGSGYKDFNINLPDEIEHILPDYNLYSCDHAYGFLTRGCPNKCWFCVVPEKEGKIKPHTDIEEFLGDKTSAVLLDNNVLASEHGIKQIEKIIKKKIKVDFNQGLDARIISEDPQLAKLLANVKWLKPLRMACDNVGNMEAIRKAVELLRWYNCVPRRYSIYVLVLNVSEAMEIVRFLKGMALDVFAQPYTSFEGEKTDYESRIFCSWVNIRNMFNGVSWEDFKKYKKYHKEYMEVES